MYIKRIDCKWCGILFDGSVDVRNHTRWCLKNPKLSEYKLAANTSQMQTAAAREKRKVSIKKAHENGKYDKSNLNRRGKSGPKHSAETKEKLREVALASPHRRLIRSIREYKKKDGTIVKLDSAWEEILAIRLDEVNINWIRPKPIKWVDKNGVYHNYFPDFYLEDYDIYLDPKNPYAIRAQKDKLDCLTDQLKNLIILTTDTDCKNFTPHRK